MKQAITAALCLLTASACVAEVGEEEIGEESPVEASSQSGLELQPCSPHITSYGRTYDLNGRVSTTIHTIYFTIRNDGVGTCVEGTRINIYLTAAVRGTDLYSRYVKLPALARGATKSYTIAVEKTAYDPVGINWTMDSLGWPLYFNQALIMTTP